MNSIKQQATCSYPRFKNTMRLNPFWILLLFTCTVLSVIECNSRFNVKLGGTYEHKYKTKANKNSSANLKPTELKIREHMLSRNDNPIL